MTSCDNIAYRLGLPCPSASHRDEEEDQKEITKNNQAGQVSLIRAQAFANAALASAVDGNPYSVLSSTLDHVNLTVQSEEAEEEMEDCAIAASPEMQMKQEEEEQLEDCEAMNADWIVIHSRHQQKEGRHQGGKETNASNCQQSRSPTKSRRPRRRRRFRYTLAPENGLNLQIRAIHLR